MLDESDSLIYCPYNRSHLIQKSRMQTHMAKCSYTNAHPQLNVEPLDMKICRFNTNHHVPAAEIATHEASCPDMATLTRFLYTNGKAKGSVIPYKPIELPPTDEDWDAENYTATYNPEERVITEPVLRAAQGVPRATRKQFRFRERVRMSRIREDSDSLSKEKKVTPRPQPVVAIEKHAFTNEALRHPKSTASVLGMGRGRLSNGQAPTQGAGRAVLSRGMANGIGANGPRPHASNVAGPSGAAYAYNSTSPELRLPSDSSLEDADGFITKVGKRNMKKNHSPVTAAHEGHSTSPLHPFGVPIPDSLGKFMPPGQGKGRGRLSKK